MLLLLKRLNDIHFSSLMAVYEEGNRENGDDLYPQETPERRLAQAEADFHDYLRQVFFPTPGAVYALWESDGKYLSALRLEPYRDGFLIAGLETAPEQRKKGYASQLLAAVQAHYSGEKLYSHVAKGNIASLATHRKCGFRRISEHAVYIDGSANNRCCTLLYE